MLLLTTRKWNTKWLITVANGEGDVTECDVNIDLKSDGAWCVLIITQSSRANVLDQDNVWATVFEFYCNISNAPLFTCKCNSRSTKCAVDFWHVVIYWRGHCHMCPFQPKYWEGHVPPVSFGIDAHALRVSYALVFAMCCISGILYLFHVRCSSERSCVILQIKFCKYDTALKSLSCLHTLILST